MSTESEVLRLLKTVKFPGLDRDIVSLGYLKDLTQEEGSFQIRVELSTNLVGAGETIETEIRRALDGAGIRYHLEMHAHYPQAQTSGGSSPGPSPTPDLLAEIPFKLAVSSGKGGVGKSTVAVNLALGLARLGHQVGILDCDIYGPSVPMMLGAQDEQPAVREHKMIPLERHGIRSISVGYLLPPDTPVIWRGPMVGKAIDQLMGDVDWSGVEIMIFDLPPGTGDIQISLSQKLSLSGAVVVSTPQDVALVDAVKGVRMFERMEVPILGLVENMSYFACPHCGQRTDIFRAGGGRREAERLGVTLLGEIPIDPAVSSGGDEGEPIVIRDPDGPAGKAFTLLAQRVAEGLGVKAR